MKTTLTWPLRILRFALWFFGQQTMTSVKVVRDAFLPHAALEPGFVVYRTRCQTEFEVTLLSSLITLTPGTLTMGATRPGAADAWDIVVHGMYFPEPDELTDALKEMEDHMLTAVRRKGMLR